MKTARSASRPRILLLPGDGIGPEVMDQARRIISVLTPRFLKPVLSDALIGGASIDAYGKPVTAAVLAKAKASDVVLLGAVGGPGWDDRSMHTRPEKGLLRVRRTLGLYANIRPVRTHAPLLKISPFKCRTARNVDLVIVRELAGGIYFGRPRGHVRSGSSARAVNTETYSAREVARVARTAFKLAAGRRRKVTSVDKANVLETSSLWRATVNRVHREHSMVSLEHMYVDNCAMQLVRDPRQFDVILTSNLFGDILSDESAMAAGSIGMLPSACLGPGTALYEPVHGSAPEISGRDIANPCAMILSVALMFRHSLHDENTASAIETAIERTIANGYRTADINAPGGASIGTAEMGRRIGEELSLVLDERRQAMPL